MAPKSDSSDANSRPKASESGRPISSSASQKKPKGSTSSAPSASGSASGGKPQQHLKPKTSLQPNTNPNTNLKPKAREEKPQPPGDETRLERASRLTA